MTACESLQLELPDFSWGVGDCLIMKLILQEIYIIPVMFIGGESMGPNSIMFRKPLSNFV
jgi:hypothetical protein